MIYGVVGMFSSGKDTVADFLVARGYPKYSFSDELVEEHIKRYGTPPPSRQAFTELADAMRKDDEAAIAKRILKKIEEAGHRDAVIISIRAAAELDTLKAAQRFKLVRVDAPLATRYARSQLRKSSKDRVTLEEFKAAEHRESNSIGTSMNLNYVLEKPDIVIENEGSLEELYDAIKEKLDL